MSSVALAAYDGEEPVVSDIYTNTNLDGQSFTLQIDHTRNDLLTPVGKQTLLDRYTQPGETFQELFARVAIYYSDHVEMAQELYDAMSRLWFMPSTPILSNGGTDRGNPISCFLNAVPDTMDGIRDIWSENVDLSSNGGGIGTYWGGVRSIAEPIKGRGQTSGIIPFVRVMDSLTLAVSQGSLRRGAAAVYLDINHPEIEEFLEIRKPSGDFNRKSLNLHHGISISDEFMFAVRAGTEFALRSPVDGSIRKHINAREFWERILDMRLSTGEPYLIFSDTISRKRPAIYKTLGHQVLQSNLCSEIALTTGMDHLGNDRTAVCCLASMNQAKQKEWFGNRQLIEYVLIFLDNVMTDFIRRTDGVAGFEKARYSAMRERSIGLGIMGFHSFLQQEGIPYESAMAKAHNIRLWKWMRATADEISREVALKRGPCPDSIDAHAIDPTVDLERWTHKFAVAPTATISIICGGTSPGGEPIPANTFTQKTLSGSFEVRNPLVEKIIREEARRLFYHPNLDAMDVASVDWEANVWSDILDNNGSVQQIDFFTQEQKENFRTAFEIDQRWCIEFASDRAPYIDQMASNNIFLPPTVDKWDLHMLHWTAWEKEVPSLYYCRSASEGKATHIGHTAGEMPLPNGEQHSYELVEAKTIDYDECLSCQ